MERLRKFNLFLGILWEWIIIPFLFYTFLPKGENFYFLFPKNFILRFFIFLVYLFFGLYFTFHSIYCLHKFGKGTIMPNDPPQKLVKEGIYSYCRNPMYLGYSYLFFSFGFLLRNISFLFISVLVVIFIFIYSKTVEEKVLMKRFGSEYLIYKKEVPFIISLRRCKGFIYKMSYFLFLCILFFLIKVIYQIIMNI